MDENLLSSIQNELHKVNKFYSKFKSIGKKVLNSKEYVMVIKDDFKSI